MQHPKYIPLTLLTFLGLAGLGSAKAGVIAIPPPGPARVAKADAVIVGKVEGLEPADVKAGTAMFRIAVVKVEDAIRGAKDAKTLRIAFTPPVKQNPMVFVSGPRPIQLTVGQGGLFILKKHATENFYTIGGIVGYYINSEKNANFAKEVASAKAAAAITADPKSSLKSKDAGERLLAAAVLLFDYRTYRGPKSTEEPIDADVSKQIMQVIADGDWKSGFDFMSLQPHPQQLFQLLGVGAKDGFVIPNGGNYQTAAQAWVRANSQKYRVKRFVAN